LHKAAIAPNCIADRFDSKEDYCTDQIYRFSSRQMCPMPIYPKIRFKIASHGLENFISYPL
jgi:hypothetical protein